MERLQQLAQEILTFVRKARCRLADYKEAGTRLIEVRSSLSHGQWQKWVEANVAEVGYRQAQKYIKLSEHWSQIEPLLAANPDVGIDEALKLPKLREHEDKVKDKRQRFEEQATKVKDMPLDERIKPFLGDCEEVLAHIPDKSVKLILTDPPYDFEGVHRKRAFAKLCRIASRVLTYDGWLCSYAGYLYLPHVLDDLREDGLLQYFWVVVLKHKESQRTKPIWLFRPKTALASHDPDSRFQVIMSQHRWMLDLLHGSGKEKDFHKWQQGTPEAELLIKKFTEPGDTVCDPFLGGGTVAHACLNTDRLFVGAEIDSQAYEIAKSRLLVAQYGDMKDLPPVA